MEEEIEHLESKYALDEYFSKEKLIEEKGVWIVYDLEANRKIQKLLLKEGYAFRFDPSLKITSHKKDEEFDEFVGKLKEGIDRIDNAKTYDKGNGIVYTKFIKEEIDKLEKEFKEKNNKENEKEVKNNEKNKRNNSRNKSNFDEQV